LTTTPWHPPYLQLEEFKKKKQAALEKKRGLGSGASSTSPSPLKLATADATTSLAVHGLSVNPPSPAPAPAPAYAIAPPRNAVAPSQEEEAEALREQVAHLLQSVDDLHHALNDERYNSSQLEQQLQNQQIQLSQLHNAHAEPMHQPGPGGAMAALRQQVSDLQAALVSTQEHQQEGEEVAEASSVAELLRDLEETRAQAHRYAAAAEAVSAELGELQEEHAALREEMERLQEDAFSQIADYKQQIDELREQLEGEGSLADGAAAQHAQHAAELEEKLAQEQQVAQQLKVSGDRPWAWIFIFCHHLRTCGGKHLPCIYLSTDIGADVTHDVQTDLDKHKKLNIKMRKQLQEQAVAAEEAAAAQDLAQEHSARADELQASLGLLNPTVV
jgi:hypothetical protein